LSKSTNNQSQDRKLGIKTYEMDRDDTAEISRQQSGIAGIATEKID
jgi:hypothetical protein